jgi:hypothetical protein
MRLADGGRIDPGSLCPVFLRSVAAMNLYFVTQCYENYGTASDPYWKPKGGDTILVTGVPDDLTDTQIVALYPAMEQASDYFTEYVLYHTRQPRFVGDCDTVMDYADVVNALICMEAA